MTSEEQISVDGSAGTAGKPVSETSDRDDYCGMPLDEWKTAIALDVQRRFGPTPKDLVSVGDPGW